MTRATGVTGYMHNYTYIFLHLLTTWRKKGIVLNALSKLVHLNHKSVNNLFLIPLFKDMSTKM